MNITVPLEPEILFELLRRSKSIRTIALNFGQTVFSNLYAKTCQVVDEIDERDRQQGEFTGMTHPIVEVRHECENVSAQYKWLRFKNYVHKNCVVSKK